MITCVKFALGSLMVAILSHMIRDLGRTEPPSRTVFWFALFGGAMMLPVLPFYMTPHDLREWLLLAGIGLFGTLGQLLLTAALRFGAVVTVIAFDYASLIWATLYGWLLWDHVPDAMLWLGAPLIVLAGLVIVWREHRLSAQPSPASGLAAD